MAARRQSSPQLLLALLGATGTCFAEALGTTTSVLLLRHCPRTPYFCDRFPPAPPNSAFKCAQNYTSKDFPSLSQWGAAEGKCTDFGLSAATELGKSLRDVLGLADGESAHVYSDSTDRCVKTAVALRLNHSEVKVDQARFDPLEARLSGCSQPNWTAAVHRQVNRMSSELSAARGQLPDLQALLGKGTAPALADIPDNITGGYLVGGLRSASELLVETLLLEKASGLPVAWGLLADKDLYELEKVHNTYFQAMYGEPEIAQRFSSGILATLMYHFAESGSKTVLVGHDINVLAIGSALGLKWQCGPFADGTTMPLAGFLFEHTHDHISVKTVCNDFNHDGSSDPLNVGLATFSDGKSSVHVHTFYQMAVAATLWSCVNLTDATSGHAFHQEAVLPVVA